MLGDDNGGVMSEPIEERSREFFVSREDLHPFAEGEVGRDDDAASAVALGEQIEEQLAAGAVEGHEPELVEDEKVDVVKSFLESTKLTRVSG